jgi:hypothetical protein
MLLFLPFVRVIFKSSFCSQVWNDQGAKESNTVNFICEIRSVDVDV